MSIINVSVNNRNIYVDIKDKIIKTNDKIIIQTDVGMECGTVIGISSNINHKISDENKFIRVASIKDINKYKKNKIDSQKAMIKCRELINKYKLNMKLFSAYYTFDRDKLIFKFTSEDRVDFRNLAKELANIYRTRIELKQVGVRDKAKEIGGCGQCGRELCCKGFLKEFNSVSINMAKNQYLALNPSKINGVCGRLLCCLEYENDTYSELKKGLPKIGNFVETENGTGKVISVDVFKKSYKVDLNDKGVVELYLDNGE